MKVTGGATVHAPIATVWSALSDPAVLVQAIPGCERLTATGPDAYELTVTAGVGTITGTYTGQIALTDQQPPSALTLRANGSGTTGTVTTNVLVQLTENAGDTLVSYDADATIGGLIAGVGQRMLAGVAKRQAAQFFAALDELLLPQAGAGAEPSAGAEASQAAAAEPGQQPAEAAEPAAGEEVGLAAAAEPGQRTGGAAGVSSATEPGTQPATGQTWERPPMKGQPAGRRVAALQPAGRRAVGPHVDDFAQGAITGAVIALAGVLVGGLIARRRR